MRITVTNLSSIDKLLDKINVRNITVNLSLANNDEICKFIPTDIWPEAAPSALIVNDNDSLAKFNRANAILNTFVTAQSINNKKFLDYGSGTDDYLITLASKHAKFALGYDPKAGLNNNLTNDIGAVKESGPYDVILIYDVIDHLQSEQERDEVLSNIFNLLAPHGVAIIRTHPFTSRHASHLYQTYNKAFVHLFYDADQILSLGYQVTPLITTLRPVITYRKLFKDHQFKLINENIISRPLEPFFTTKDILEYLATRHWSGDNEVMQNLQILHSILSIQYIDYKLTK